MKQANQTEEQIMADLAEVLGWEEIEDGWRVNQPAGQVLRIALDVTLENFLWEYLDGGVRQSAVLRSQAG